MTKFSKPLNRISALVSDQPFEKIKDLARDVGNTYLKHRERIDPALIGHAVTTAALTAAAHKVAISAITIKLAPIAVAAAGAYYGPQICRMTRDFLSEKKAPQEIRLLVAPERIQAVKQESPYRE